MKNANLKVVSKQGSSDLSISEIIGRDAKPVLNLKRPVFDESPEVRVDFYRKGIKWLNSIELFPKGWTK
jgi:hypothetical protein